MSKKINILFIVGVIAFLSVTEVKSGDSEGISYEIPPAVVEYGLNKVDKFLSCSRYDGVAACYFDDGGKDKRDFRVRDECGGNANVWDYKFSSIFGGKCHCIKCKD